MGNKIRVRFKKNRVGVPQRTAQFTLNYGTGITDIGTEIFELAKSLDVIYHPINKDTGKENNKYWVFGDYDPFLGEAKIREFVTNNKKVQDELLIACDSASADSIEARNKVVAMLDILDPEEDLMSEEVVKGD